MSVMHILFPDSGLVIEILSIHARNLLGKSLKLEVKLVHVYRLVGMRSVKYFKLGICTVFMSSLWFIYLFVLQVRIFRY